MIKKMQNVKLNPEKEKWNKRIEEEYNKHKEEEMLKIKEKRENANKDPKKELVIQYQKLQKDYICIDNDETLKKWKILSSAYSIGKKIYGQGFSVMKLSQHFDIPYTTTKRVLSLDKANKRTWELIKDKKISAFKVAQICMSKNNKYQDQIIDLVIAENFSICKIKDIRITKNGLDVRTARLEKAIEDGYARQSSAFKAIKDTSKRMMRLLDIKTKDIPKVKIPEVIKILDELQLKIGNKILELI